MTKRKEYSDDDDLIVLESQQARRMSALCVCGHARVFHLGSPESQWGHDGPCEFAACDCVSFRPERLEEQCIE